MLKREQSIRATAALLTDPEGKKSFITITNQNYSTKDFDPTWIAPTKHKPGSCFKDTGVKAWMWIADAAFNTYHNGL